MMRIIASVALWLMLPVSMMAGDSGVVEQLRQEFVGKSFAIRVPVAASTCLLDPGMPRPTTRLVDTEISNSTVNYYARGSGHIEWCSDSAGSGNPSFGGLYIDAGLVANMHPVNSMMNVSKVEAKQDRIEFLLTVIGQPPNKAYGKIKLMLGKGYESRSLEQIELVLANALVLPRIESIRAETARLDSARSAISELERELATERTAEGRVDKASLLVNQYQGLVSAEERLNKVAFQPVSVDSPASRIAELRAIISEGQRQLAVERIRGAAERYQSSVLLMKASCGLLDAPPARNRSELNRAVAALETAKKNMQEFERTQKEMEALGQVVSGDNKEFHANCLANSEVISRTLNSQQQAILQAEAEAAERRRQTQEAAEERRVAEMRIAENKKAAASNARQQYAAALSGRMSGEIIWCATGRDNDILAGYVRTNHLSETVISLLSGASPLWREFYNKGFRYRGILDRDRVIKVAQIREAGGFSLQASSMPEYEHADLDATVQSLAVNGSCRIEQ